MSLNSKRPQRLIIYSGDVMQITNCARRTANDKLCLIRIAKGKPPGSWVTVKEFCEYEGLDPDDIYPFLL